MRKKWNARAALAFVLAVLMTTSVMLLTVAGATEPTETTETPAPVTEEVVAPEKTATPKPTNSPTPKPVVTQAPTSGGGASDNSASGGSGASGGGGTSGGGGASGSSASDSSGASSGGDSSASGGSSASGSSGASGGSSDGGSSGGASDGSGTSNGGASGESASGSGESDSSGTSGASGGSGTSDGSGASDSNGASGGASGSSASGGNATSGAPDGGASGESASGSGTSDGSTSDESGASDSGASDSNGAPDTGASGESASDASGESDANGASDGTPDGASDGASDGNDTSVTPDATLPAETEASPTGSVAPEETPAPENKILVTPTNITVTGSVSIVGWTAPATVKVVLLRNGEAIDSKAVNVQSAGGASYTFAELPDCNATGVPYQYTVYGAPVRGYSAAVSGYDIVYTAGSQTVSIVANVSWGGTEPLGHVRPTAKVLLRKRTSTGDTVAQTWSTTVNGSHTFTATVRTGETYYVTQNALGGYETTYTSSSGYVDIVNTYMGDQVAVSGKIYWVSSTVQKPAFSITLTRSDGITTTISAPTTYDDDNSYVFPALDSAYTYRVSASAPSGYTVSVSGSGRTYDITLTKNDPLFRLAVVVNWKDNNNRREKRPGELRAYLFCNGSDTGVRKLLSWANDWTAVFYDLIDSDNYHYTVKVDKNDYYSTSYNRVARGVLYVNKRYGRSGESDSSAAVQQSPKVGDPTGVLSPAAIERKFLRASSEGQELASTARSGGAVDFAALKKTNGNTVAWLTLDASPIDYPIVQGGDNTRYLTRLFNGKSGSGGTLFLDCNDSSSFSGRNATVYGHNMKDGSMFAALLNYRTQGYYDQHPAFRLETPTNVFRAEPVAGFYTDAAYDNVARRSFASDSAFMAYVDRCVTASDFTSDATVSASDRLITFVTCSPDYSDGQRYVLLCKLSPAD